MINPATYDHLPFIAAAYGLFAAATIWFAVGARMRLGRAAARLRATDRRATDKRSQTVS